MGDILGMIIFLVEVSDCCMDPPPLLPPDSTPGDVSCVPAPPPPIQTDREIRLKFLDDTTVAECLNLKRQLKEKDDVFIGPKSFHNRNSLELISETSILQARLRDLKRYTVTHDMRINSGKTKVIPFNFTKKFDFIPQLNYGSKELEVTYKAKLYVVCVLLMVNGMKIFFS